MTETTAIIPKQANESVKTIYPVSFRVLNDKHEEKIYLENKPSSGILEIKNQSGTDIYFAPQDTEKIAGPENYHFALRFRPGILKSDIKSLIKNKIIKKGWTLTIGLVDIKSGEINRNLVSELTDSGLKKSAPVLYFLNTDKSVFSKAKALLLPLKHLHLACEEGTQVTQVELFCNDLSITSDYSEIVKSHIKHFNLTIVNHMGSPYMPIHVGFTGFNTILNDGLSSNTLNLRITNLQKRTPESKGNFTFSHHKHSKMYLYFNTDTESAEVALGTVDQVSGIELDIKVPLQENDNELVHEPFFQGNNPIWEIFPQDGDVVLQPHLTVLHKGKTTELPDDSCFDIEIKGLKTDFFMGVTNLYLRMENIPGYWDHTYAIPISKQPMVFVPLFDLKYDETAIRPELYSAILKVLKGHNVSYNTISPSNHLQNVLPVNKIRSQVEALKGALEDIGVNVKLVPNKEERVGIGTVNPANKLSVAGNADVSGNVGIGVNTPTNKLSVEGNADFSGNVGIGNANPSNRLSVSGNADFSGTITASDYNLTDKGHNGPIPKGGIIMWSGDINNIPIGWHLCDGSSPEIPDLRDKFIVGAGRKYSPKNWKDNKEEVQLSINELPAHNHQISINGAGNHWHKALFDTGSGGSYGQSPDGVHMWKDGDGGSGLQNNNPYANGFTPTTVNGDHTHGATIYHSGSGKPFSIIPSYFALAFIIKI